MHLKIPSAKYEQFRLDLNTLTNKESSTMFPSDFKSLWVRTVAIVSVQPHQTTVICLHTSEALKLNNIQSSHHLGVRATQQGFGGRLKCLWVFQSESLEILCCIKIISFEVWGRYFVWNFFESSHKIFYPYTSKYVKALRFKSSQVFLKRSPGFGYGYGIVLEDGLLGLHSSKFCVTHRLGSTFSQYSYVW